MPAAPDFTTFKTSIREWANREDWSDELTTGFVRAAEEKFNLELRIDRMLQTDDALITGACAPLPDDWLEFDFVKLADGNGRFWPIRYMMRDQFFDSDAAKTKRYYTIEGREIVIGGKPDDVNGRTAKITYYAEVPVFADDNKSWIYTKYSSLYRFAALMHADLHAVGEEDKAGMLKTLVEDMIQKMNAAHRYARASGSKLARTQMRSFG
jgi:hypothetical protein